MFFLFCQGFNTISSVVENDLAGRLKKLSEIELNTVRGSEKGNGLRKGSVGLTKLGGLTARHVQRIS